MKLCLFCKRFYFSAAEEDWSEYTPGDDAEMGCGKGYFALSVSADTLKKYRKCILMAETCEHYEQIEIEEDEELTGEGQQRIC